MIVVSISAECTRAGCASVDCANADCASAVRSCLSIQRAAPYTLRSLFIASRFFGAHRAAQWKPIRPRLPLTIKHCDNIKTPLFQVAGGKLDQYNLWCYHCPSLVHTALSASTRSPRSTKHSDVLKTLLQNTQMSSRLHYKKLRGHQDTISSVIPQKNILDTL